MAVVLKDLLLNSKDGEWGKGEPSDDSVAMLAIRGTDFDDVRHGSLTAVPMRHIPSRIAARKSLRPLDIIFETAGGSKDRPTGRSLLLKSPVFRKTDSPLTCASFARFLRVDPQKADPEFVFWMLQHMYNAGILRQYHTQHTGVARYQYTTFAENEPLELPKRNAQCRIASILSAYDDLIENNTRRIAILEEMALRIYEEWFVRFRFPGHENMRMVESHLGLVPEGWNVVTVSDAIQRFGTGQKYDQKSVAETGAVPVLDQGKQGVIGYHDNEPGFVVSLSDPVVVFANHTCYQRLIYFPFSTIQNVIPYKASASYSRDIYWVFHATLGLVRLSEYKGHWPQFEAKLILVPTKAVARNFGDKVRSLHQLGFKLSRVNANLRATRDLLHPSSSPAS